MLTDSSAFYDPTGTEADHAKAKLGRAARLEAKAKAQGVCLHSNCPPPALVCSDCGRKFSDAYDWRYARQDAEDSLS